MSANNNREGGPSEDFKCGYTAGYDQAQFDLSQGSDPFEYRCLKHGGVSGSGAGSRCGICDQESPIRTLRDEFAMTALVNCSDHMGNPKDMADAAYEIADAMLTAREGA